MRRSEETALRVRILGPDDLPRRLRPQAEALWAWYDATGAGMVVGRRREEVLEAAVRVCEETGLDPRHLSGRQSAAERLAGGLAITDGADLDRFAEDWCGAHARLVAGLVGLRGTWQQDMASDLARGFFLTATVIRAGDDLEAGRVFFPADDLERLGVDVSHLRGERGKPVLWKQAVRARDALARGRPVIEDLPRILAFRARRYWFGALEILAQAEDADWDVWSRGSLPGPVARFRVDLLAAVGRTAFRRR